MNTYPAGKFHTQDGQPDIDQIEEWVQSFFASITNMVNGFYCRLDIQEAASGLENIPFEKMVREQLEAESDEVIAIAVAKIKELAQIEIEYLKAYQNRG